METALKELREARASLSRLSSGARELKSNSCYAKAYIHGLDHSIEIISNRIVIIEQNIKINEIISKNRTSAV